MHLSNLPPGCSVRDIEDACDDDPRALPKRHVNLVIQADMGRWLAPLTVPDRLWEASCGADRFAAIVNAQGGAVTRVAHGVPPVYTFSGSYVLALTVAAYGFDVTEIDEDVYEAQRAPVRIACADMVA